MNDLSDADFYLFVAVALMAYQEENGEPIRFSKQIVDEILGGDHFVPQFTLSMVDEEQNLTLSVVKGDASE